jgi:hypothetical protein
MSCCGVRLKVESLRVGKGGLPPLTLNGIQAGRGQAALPDLEVIHLEESSFSIFVQYLGSISWSSIFVLRMIGSVA